MFRPIHTCVSGFFTTSGMSGAMLLSSAWSMGAQFVVRHGCFLKWNGQFWGTKTYISTTDKNKGMPDSRTTTRNLLLLLCQLHLQRKWQFGYLKKSAMKTGRSKIEASPPERWWLSLKTSHLQPETMRYALWEIFSPTCCNASRAQEGKKKNVNSPKILIKSHACISIFHKSKNILQNLKTIHLSSPSQGTSFSGFINSRSFSSKSWAFAAPGLEIWVGWFGWWLSFKHQPTEDKQLWLLDYQPKNSCN